jgi:hypothetical protein
MSLDLTANHTSCEAKSVEFEVLDSSPRRGRPATLTLRRFITLCHRVESGWSIVKAAESQGITYRALRMRVARNPRLQERLREAEQIRFNVRCEIAAESVIAAGRDSWLAHAWWLERNLPQLYALRQVNRSDPDAKQVEPELPAQVIAKHRELMLQLVKEDAESRLSEIPKLKTVP